MTEWCNGRAKIPHWLTLSKKNHILDYKKWFKSEEPYEIFVGTQTARFFEPLWMGLKNQIPGIITKKLHPSLIFFILVFDESFIDGTYSKKSAINHALSLGYSFSVLPNAFVVKRSDAVKSYLDDAKLHYEIVRDIATLNIGRLQYEQSIHQTPENLRKQKYQLNMNRLYWNEAFQ